MFSVRKRKKLRRIFCVVGGFTILSSCAPFIQDAAKDVPSSRKGTAATMFHSDDYVVYRLEGGESADSLAARFLGDMKRAWVIEEANRAVSFEKDQFVVIPLTDERRGGLTPEGYQTVPVLCYHRFAERCEASLCTPTALFEKQMSYLKENGYRVISMAEFIDFLSFRRSLPQKTVVITLDDAYSSIYEVAYPILKKHGYTATLFIYTDFIGSSKSAMTWDQLQAMKEEGFEVGCHSLSHDDLTKKKEGESEEAYLSRVKRELSLSKQIIDQKLNQNTAYIAYPYGEYNQRLLVMCEEVGYKLGFSVKKGGNPFFSDPFTLKRDQMLQKDMESFITRLRTFHELPLK